jgi:hypothetical protein
MRVTCKRGDYDLCIGCWDISGNVDISCVHDGLRAHEYLIRGPQGLFSAPPRGHVVLSRLWLPGAAVSSLTEERYRRLQPVVPYVQTTHLSWDVRYPSVEDQSFIELITELEEHMMQAYLASISDIVCNPWQYRGHTPVWQRHGMRQYNCMYVIRPYEEGLLLRLVQQHAARYKIAEALANGGKWTPA